MPVQLTIKEQKTVDTMVRSKGGSPMDAVRKLQADRIKAAGGRSRNLGPAKHAVYRYIHGKTHVKDAVENRGRKTVPSNADVRKLDLARVRLIRRSQGKRVRYCDILKEVGMQGKVCLKTAANALRATSVRFRPARKKIFITDKDVETRMKWCRTQHRKPKEF